MKWRVNELAGEYQMKTGVSLTNRDISKETGIAESTISRITNGKSERVDFDTLNTLLGYFSGKLEKDLSTGDLLQYTKDGN